MIRISPLLWRHLIDLLIHALSQTPAPSSVIAATIDIIRHRGRRYSYLILKEILSNLLHFNYSKKDSYLEKEIYDDQHWKETSCSTEANGRRRIT
ncbi:hypothetical protein V3C99_016066 [Haemonchus contortus]